MSKFLTTLDIRSIDEFAGIHEVLAPLIYQSELLRRLVRVPPGFRTDFASVPRIPLIYSLVGGKGAKAAVVHDYLYSGGILVDRETADGVFAEALSACGYGWATVKLMYLGVRIGGASRFTAPNLAQPADVVACMGAAVDGARAA